MATIPTNLRGSSITVGRQSPDGMTNVCMNLCEHFAYGLGVPAGRTSRHTTLNEEEFGVRVVRAISSNHNLRTHRASRVYLVVNLELLLIRILQTSSRALEKRSKQDRNNRDANKGFHD
jgi:hypothetical protein